MSPYRTKDVLAGLNGGAEVSSITAFAGSVPWTANPVRVGRSFDGDAPDGGFWVFFHWGRSAGYQLTWGENLGNLDAQVPTVAGKTYTPRLWAQRNENQNGPAGPEGWDLEVQWRPHLDGQDPWDNWTTLLTISEPDVPLDSRWYHFTAPAFVATTSKTELRTRTVKVGVDNAIWKYDGLQLLEDLEMATSKLDQFLTNLQAEIEGIDPNIGQVYVAERLWKTDQEIVDDGGALVISLEGLFDGAGMVGETVTRFWIISPMVETTRLTNKSNEHKNAIQIQGFFGRRDDESSVISIRQAATAIVDHLKDNAVELGTLAASMGAGYEGFLESPPKMLEPPRSASLAESGLTGNSVRLEVTYFEEVNTF